MLIRIGRTASREDNADLRAPPLSPGQTQAKSVAEHVCPIWMGYFLANPLRKLFQNPSKILGPYVKPNMKVLDFGCAMGFFSLPMAKAVEPEGTVVCVDLQFGMLSTLQRRAARAGLSNRIETHLCRQNAIGLQGQDNSFDVALAFAALHEVPDQARILGEIHQLLKPGAVLLLAEPRGHVTANDFEQSMDTARNTGFVVAERPDIRQSHAALLAKTAQRAN